MPKAYIVSLGCPKNLTDTEVLMGQLAREGYQFTQKPSDADLILVNTCAFLQSAKKESIETIKKLAAWKKKGKCRYLIAAGCLPQRYKSEMPKLLPEVDAFIGTPGKFPKKTNKLIKAANPWFAYVKIAEGCGNRCTYCAVPMIRGPLRLRPMKDILDEVRLLAGTGVKEIIFVAQDTAVYHNLPALLAKTASIKGIRWIRIMYAHPEHVSDAIIHTIAKQKKVVKYIDLPIQHACDKILKRMNRRYTRLELEKLIEKIRRRIPKIALRTSVIVGFPGESEADFEELLGFIKKVKFERLGVFTYSKEKGTPAYKMRGQVSEAKKIERSHRLMKAQSRISRELNRKLIAKTLETIIEGVKHGCFVGRSYMDAPDIDGQVFIKSSSTLKPGEIVRTRVTKARTYDLYGCLT